jgi:transketolase
MTGQGSRGERHALAPRAGVPAPSIPAASSRGASTVSESSTPALDWSDLDRRAVDTVRVLAMDAVEASGNGHPGTAMSLAPAAYLLWQRLLRHDPTDPGWTGRDRFVLSCGHTSLTLYLQLYLSGYGLELDDLKRFRKWGSRTPGHPEHGHTVGVETTTGPLGQGLGNAVGMAMAARYERGLLDPDAPEGESPFDHTIWCIASDGDIEEGISHEASALAGHQRLGNLVLLYDDNSISIEGDTKVALSEDVLARYAAYGWHTQRIEDVNDVQALWRAFIAARDETARPSIIAVRSIIAWPAPNAQNTGKAHGAALGADEVARTKEILGFDPTRSFEVADDVLRHAREVVDRGRQLRAEWQRGYEKWRESSPERAELHDRLQARRLPAGWADALPTFPPGKDVATRKASGAVINAVAARVPEFWGGSADLAESNNTTIEGGRSFLPEGYGDTDFGGASPYGRVLHFGVREHAMGAALNGIALHGGTRAFGGTFLVFSDYMRPSVRLAALMRLPVTYVWTHDSIGLGEDGPTHQPVEHLAALRAIPGLAVVRPADANETTVAWRTVLERADGPAGLCLSRQNLPVLDRGPDSGHASAEGVARGAYVLAEASSGAPQVVLVGTGAEVHLALQGRSLLEADGIPTRVVSMPCREWFDAQPPAYRDEVLPPAVKARVSVEAGVAQGWREVVGDAGRCVSLEHFGASADYQTLFREFGITPEAVASAARACLEALPA